MRRRLLAGSLVLLVAAGLGLASASNLAVGSSRLGATDLTAPCPGSAVVTAVGATDVPAGQPAYGGIAVTLPAGCTGARDVQVTLHAGSQVVTSSAGSVTTSGTLSTANYYAQTVTGAVATVDGWNLPVTWSFAPPATCQVTSGSGTCIAGVTLWTGQRNGGSSSALYFDVWVTTTSTSWVTYTVTFDLSSPYYGTTVTRLGNSDLDGYVDGRTTFSSTRYVNDVHRVSSCSTLPALVVTGDGNGSVSTKDTTNIRNFSLVRDDHARYFSLVVNRTEAGYFDVLAPGC